MSYRYFLFILLAAMHMLSALADKQPKAPKDPDLLAAMGTECLKRGDIAAAEHYYELGFKQKRITTTIICLAGDIALAKNDRQKADYY